MCQVFCSSRVLSIVNTECRYRCSILMFHRSAFSGGSLEREPGQEREYGRVNTVRQYRLGDTEIPLEVVLLLTERKY